MMAWSAVCSVSQVQLTTRFFVHEKLSGWNAAVSLSVTVALSLLSMTFPTSCLPSSSGFRRVCGLWHICVLLPGRRSAYFFPRPQTPCLPGAGAYYVSRLRSTFCDGIPSNASQETGPEMRPKNARKPAKTLVFRAEIVVCVAYYLQRSTSLSRFSRKAKTWQTFSVHSPRVRTVL